MSIKEGYEVATKELKDFTQSEIEYYEGQGQSVDKASFSAYCQNVFLLGKIQDLTDRLEALETKGVKNVTKKATKRNTDSGKANGKSTDQLGLNV